MQQILTDPAALARNRQRAIKAGLPARFLHEDAICEIHERLAMVNRSFRAAALVTGFPQIWAPAFPEAMQIADDETLDLEPGAHDLIIHAMGLHWANDPVGQLLQCKRALKPDGLCLAVTLGGRSLQELRHALAQAESECRGGLSPRVLPMAEIRDLGGLLQRAGFAMPVADSVTLPASYASIASIARDLRDMGENNALAQRDRRPTSRDLFKRAEAIYRAEFPAPDGRLMASFELILLAGWAPADSQPKALRPGSATTRLSDALNSREQALPDAGGFDP